MGLTCSPSKDELRKAIDSMNDVGEPQDEQWMNQQGKKQTTAWVGGI